MIKEKSYVAVYGTHLEAEEAVKKLQTAGFKMNKLSIVARDYNTEEQVVGYYNVGDRMAYWGKQGVFWGGIWGLLFGSAFFWVPGIGPLVVAGPLAAAIAAALEGAMVFGGIGVIGAGLLSIGVPEDNVIEYEVALTAGKYVLVAHGTSAETEQAQEILKNSGHERAERHSSEQPSIHAAPNKDQRSSASIG